MSRGQKRQYGGGGYTDYYEQDFVGFRDNNNHHNNQVNQNFQGGGRSGGGWSGRGRGMRKHQQSRLCYVNAEFITQENTPDLQNMHGVRRRVGWASGGSGDNDASINRYHLDNRIHNNNNNNSNSSDIRLDDHCDDIFTDISVTVPSLTNRRSEDETFDFGNGRQRVPAVRTTPAITGYSSSNIRKKKRRPEAEEQLEQLETEVVVHRANHRRHKKSKRSKRNRGDEGNDSGADIHLLSSPSDAEGDEDEDLRYTIVRQKSVRNNFRREPGEILDTDESSSISSQKSENKEMCKSSDGSKSKKSSSASKNNEDGKDTKTSTTTSIRSGDLCPEVDDKIVELRPISAESLSQDTIASVSSSVAETNNDHSQGGCNTIENSRTNSLTNLLLPEDRNLGEALNSQENVTISAGLLDAEVELGSKKENENNINISNVQSPSSVCSGGLFILESENTGSRLSAQSSSEIVVQRPASASAALEKRSRRGVSSFRKVTLRSPATTQNSQNKVHYSSSGLSMDPIDSYWKAQTIRLKTEMASLDEQLNMKDIVINDLKRQVKLGEEKDAKIKVLRGRKTSMENEMEEIKKNMSKSEKRLKDAEQKLKKVELELKLKQEEVESLKRRDVEPANDANKTEIQLIYALTYQDRLFVEVEKVKSSFEIEVLKLQEYYEARLAHYRNQGLHPGPFMGPNNNFPKGCVVTPLNIGQPLSLGHQSHNQEQNGMPRTESRSMQQQQMGLFAHLGNPDAVSPPLINIPQGMSRTRLPVFLNPMMRRMQQGVEASQLQPHAIQGMQHQNPNSSLLIPSTNSNSVNNNNNNSNQSNSNNIISSGAGGQNSAFSR